MIIVEPGAPDTLASPKGMGIFIMTRYKNDPFPLTVRYAGRCSRCGCALAKGAPAFYWPSSRQVLCTACGEPEYRGFLASAEDEDWYLSQRHR